MEQIGTWLGPSSAWVALSGEYVRDLIASVSLSYATMAYWNAMNELLAPRLAYLCAWIGDRGTSID